MKFTRLSAAAAALATCFATACTTPAFALDASAPPAGARAGGDGSQSDKDTAPGGPPRERERFGPAGGPHGFGGHGPGAPGPDMPFAHLPLYGLQLTDVQQDKVFAIMHAQAPQRREHEKAIRKAHDALRELAHADKFDDARAAALARDLGQAIAADALLQARTQAQLLAVLTPEQRERLRQRRARGPERRGPDGADGPGGRPDHR
jgi:Spy/CpxP family protein refolding chaperone